MLVCREDDARVTLCLSDHLRCYSPALRRLSAAPRALHGRA
jgi:hypothetical protein